jgi:hypothetical protein
MLIIITGTVCGIVIVLLLIAVTMLALILVTKSRNSRRRYVCLEHNFPKSQYHSIMTSTSLESLVNLPVYVRFVIKFYY